MIDHRGSSSSLDVGEQERPKQIERQDVTLAPTRRTLRETLSTHAEWWAFERQSWERAVRERGLKLRSLDADQQQPFFEAMQFPRALRQWARRLQARLPVPMRKALGAVLPVCAGCYVHDIIPTANHVLSVYANMLVIIALLMIVLPGVHTELMKDIVHGPFGPYD